jgi:hypothetical protein
MYVCEYGFLTPDPKDPTYSQLEIQFYAFIRIKNQNRTLPHWKYLRINHRLFLRKNLDTGDFELVKKYHNDRKEWATKEKVILKTKDLQEALDRGHDMFEKHHEESQRDLVCRHKSPEKDSGCMRDHYIFKDSSEGLKIMDRGLIN